MGLDEKVGEAIYAAVEQRCQSAKVAKKLISWLEELANGNASLSNSEDTKAYLEAILAAIKIDELKDEDEE